MKAPFGASSRWDVLWRGSQEFRFGLFGSIPKRSTNAKIGE